MYTVQPVENINDIENLQVVLNAGYQINHTRCISASAIHITSFQRPLIQHTLHQQTSQITIHT